MHKYIFRPELEYKDKSDWPNWLQLCTTIDADIEIINDDCVIWNNGIFVDGTWVGYTWNDGIFIGSKWARGTWINGYWHNGIAYKIYWGNGVWNDGILYDGRFRSGVWRCGNLYTSSFFGDYISGYSNNLKFKYTGNILNRSDYPKWLKSADILNEVISIQDDKLIWHCGDWYDGIWKDGVWQGGRWFNGKWQNGDFLSGEWYNGDWIRGNFKGIWSDGIFRSGRFLGLWGGGVNMSKYTQPTPDQYISKIESVINCNNIQNIDELKSFLSNNSLKLEDDIICQEPTELAMM